MLGVHNTPSSDICTTTVELVLKEKTKSSVLSPTRRLYSETIKARASSGKVCPKHRPKIGGLLLRKRTALVTCAVCSTCTATVFRKKYSHASLRCSCVHFSRDVRVYLLFRNRAFAETRKLKVMAGKLVTITVGFSFNSTFLSLLIDGRLQLP